MGEYISTIQSFVTSLPVWVIVLTCILLFIGVVGQWALYEKCGLPGYACLVPVWNVIVFLKIVGRPASQGWIIMLPPLVIVAAFLFVPNLTYAIVIAGFAFAAWFIFLVIVCIEICQSFGKYNVASYILIVLFNGLYLFNLALSQEEKYYGPVYSTTE